MIIGTIAAGKARTVWLCRTVPDGGCYRAVTARTGGLCTRAEVGCCKSGEAYNL